MAGELRAILVDHDSKRVADFREVWQMILRKVFPQVDVRVVDDIESARDLMTSRPHLAIMENVFPDESTGQKVPNRGVDFIVEQKRWYPDCLFILYTGNTFQVDVLGNKYPNPDLIVTKTSLKNLSYQK
jgi:hypothetical protein